jgi:hypothetical protein
VHSPDHWFRDTSCLRQFQHPQVYIPCMSPRNHAACVAILTEHSRSLLAQFGLTPKSRRGLAAGEAVFRISEVQESPAFNGRLSFLTLRHLCHDWQSPASTRKQAVPDLCQHWQSPASTGKQAVPDLCQHWQSSASTGPRPCQRIRISPSCGGRAKRRSTSPACHPETMSRVWQRLRREIIAGRSLLAQFGLTPKSKRGLAASDPGGCAGCVVMEGPRKRVNFFHNRFDWSFSRRW